MKLFSFSLLALALTMGGEPMCNPENYSSTAPSDPETGWGPGTTQPEINWYVAGYIYDVESEAKLKYVQIDVPQAGISNYSSISGYYSFNQLKSGTYTVIARCESYATDSCSVTISAQCPGGNCYIGLRKLGSTGD
jgi:hypothetical protein